MKDRDGQTEFLKKASHHLSHAFILTMNEEDLLRLRARLQGRRRHFGRRLFYQHLELVDAAFQHRALPSYALRVMSLVSILPTAGDVGCFEQHWVLGR